MDPNHKKLSGIHHIDTLSACICSLFIKCPTSSGISLEAGKFNWKLSDYLVLFAALIKCV